MNYPIPAKTYSSASEMLAEGKARRERLMRPNVAVRGPTVRRFLCAPVPKPVVAQAEIVQPARWRVIMVEVAAKHGITVRDIQSTARFHHFVAARHEAAYRMAVETVLSYPQIGQRMGGRDHSTVLNSIKKYALLLGVPFPIRVEAAHHG